MRKFFLILGLLVMTTAAAAVGIDIEVQPDDPVANESFRLIYRADGPIDAEPDFKELDTVLDVLSRNRQTSIQWINGKNTHTTTWVLDVIAGRPGELTLPPVAFGRDQTLPRTLAIAEKPLAASGADNVDLILETEVDVAAPYVQQQVILTARLLRRVELSDANLTDPTTSADAIIKRLGNDSTYQTRRNGKRYEVFERKYAIFSQTSGMVTINPLLLVTQVIQGTRSLFDPFRQGVKTRRIESNAIALDVKPIPASFTGDTWLPAKRLSLRDDWVPNDDNVKPGEPITRTVFLWADGLNAGQLPDVTIPIPSSVKTYPDQPQSSEQATETGFNAIRQQKFAIIPNESGALRFEAVAVNWWNTETDAMETAELAVRQLNVEGAPMIAPTDNAPPQSESVGAVAAPPVASQSIDPTTVNLQSKTQTAPGYQMLSVALFVLWLATLLIWWWQARSNRTTDNTQNHEENPGLAKARRDVLGACRGNDPRTVKDALLRWARVWSPTESIKSLSEIARRVPAPLSSELDRLNEALYGQSSAQAWDGSGLREAFKVMKSVAPEPTELQRNVKPLPDLYELSGS